jgi:hypothetical protein
MTPEQAIGQILQLVGKLQERIQEIENRLLRKEDADRHELGR